MKRLNVMAVSILFPLCIFAQNQEFLQPQTQTSDKLSSKRDLIDMAGRQRMLSQRMVKDYLYMGKKIAYSKAQKQLNTSLDEFLNSLNSLKISLNDAEVKNLLEFVSMSFDDFKKISNEPFNKDNAQIALDLSESLLEGSQFVVDKIENSSILSSNKAKSKIVAKSGKQRMLAQRIAKYYVAYQIGIKDKNSIDQMKATVKEFAKNHKELMSYKNNTQLINQKLADVDKLWNIVYKFYLNIQKGGLPFIVFKSTDDITKKMDEITKLYASSAK